MRPIALPVLLLLAVISTAQEKKEHDELGFPITFNNERITRGDVARSTGASPEAVTGQAIAAARDQMLMNLLVERMGEIWGISVREAEVKTRIKREMELVGGEAKFYEYLNERGDTLARYKEARRLQILRTRLDYLLNNGMLPPPINKVLPWSVVPTPQEVRLAFERDKKRLSQEGARARGLVITIRLDVKERMAIVQKDGLAGLEKEALRQAGEIIAQLEKGKDFLSLARDLAGEGADLKEESKRWYRLPKDPADDHVVRFFQTARPATWSRPIAQAGGVAKIAYLIERQNPGDRTIDDAELFRSYSQRIQGLRRDKAEAMLRLEALNRSELQPEFLRKQFRQNLVADLRLAMQELKQLGLN